MKMRTSKNGIYKSNVGIGSETRNWMVMKPMATNYIIQPQFLFKLFSLQVLSSMVNANYYRIFFLFLDM